MSLLLLFHSNVSVSAGTFQCLTNETLTASAVVACLSAESLPTATVSACLTDEDLTP